MVFRRYTDFARLNEKVSTNKSKTDFSISNHYLFLTVLLNSCFFFLVNYLSKVQFLPVPKKIHHFILIVPSLRRTCFFLKTKIIHSVKCENLKIINTNITKTYLYIIWWFGRAEVPVSLPVSAWAHGGSSPARAPGPSTF